MEVVLEDGSISSGVSQVLDKWKNEFSNLLNKRYESADYSCILVVKIITRM